MVSAITWMVALPTGAHALRAAAVSDGQWQIEQEAHEEGGENFHGMIRTGSDLLEGPILEQFCR